MTRSVAQISSDIPLTRRRLMGIAAACGVSACTPALFQSHQSIDTFRWKTSAPETVGLSPTLAAELSAVLQSYIDSNQITGAAAAVARNNQLVYFNALGQRNLETGESMRKDDVFRMASATKVVVAVAILTLLDEGRLSLDDKVSRFVPGFENLKVVQSHKASDGSETRKLVPPNREVTLRDLLTHTSGLASSGFPDSTLINDLAEEIIYAPDDTLATYVPRLANGTLEFQPGSRFSYSPLAGFDVLAYIVQAVSGQPANVFMKERIFEPLDMRSTWFHVPASEQDRVVPLYRYVQGEWRARKGLLENLPPRYVSGAGGLFSSAHDFLNFYQMFLNHGSLNGRRVLKPATVDLLSTNQVGSLFAEWVPPVTSGMGFGLGVRIILDSEKVPHRGVGSYGWGGAYGTEPWADPALGITGVIMVQQNHMALAPTFQAALKKAIVA